MRERRRNGCCRGGVLTADATTIMSDTVRENRMRRDCVDVSFEMKIPPMVSGWGPAADNPCVCVCVCVCVRSLSLVIVSEMVMVERATGDHPQDDDTTKEGWEAVAAVGLCGRMVDVERSEFDLSISQN